MGVATGIISFTVTRVLQSGFQNDKRKDGWELYHEGANVSNGQFRAEAVPILIGDEEKIDGLTMFSIAINGKSGGQYLAEYLLKNQEAIPKELQGKILVFADTLCLVGGYLGAPCLYWDGGEWDMRFDGLDDDWDSDSMFVRVCA